MYFKIQSKKQGSNIWVDVPLKPILTEIKARKIRTIMWMHSRESHSRPLSFRIVKVRS